MVPLSSQNEEEEPPAGPDVCMDASVLINFSHTGRFDLLGALPRSFILLAEVRAEIGRPDQLGLVDGAVSHGWLVRRSLPAVGGADLYVQFRTRLGSGESAALAYAHLHGVAVGCDERNRVFRRVLDGLDPRPQVFDTAAVYLASIRSGLISVADADADKMLLADCRFAMKCHSFADLL